MKPITLLSSLLLCVLSPLAAMAQTQTIDISGNNTSSNYISYSTSISLPVGKTVDVKMARYCYFSSTISGTGILNLYAGGSFAQRHQMAVCGHFRNGKKFIIK